MNANPKSQTTQTVPSNTEKDPDDWTTGEELMTGAQASYLKTLCEEAGEAFDPGLNKAEASKMIDALQGKTGRGLYSLTRLLHYGSRVSLFKRSISSRLGGPLT